MTEKTSEYQQGHRDATDQVREDLAAALRLHAIVNPNGDEQEVLSDAMVREIFSAVFGTVATDEEFGPEPTGRGVRDMIERKE